jgi:hypothetical protein
MSNLVQINIHFMDMKKTYHYIKKIHFMTTNLIWLRVNKQLKII